MAETTAISIGLHLNNKVIDLRLPRYVNEQRLKEIIRECLEVLHEPVPQDFELKILNKSLTLDEVIPLHHYPLGDGDQFLVETKREETQ